MSAQEILKHLLSMRPLSPDEADAWFEELLAGRLDDAQIAAGLSLIQARGATTEELFGAARAMRRHATRIPYAGPGVILDTCGTGGAPKTFNISTIVALVVAAAGEGRIKVAKHGNRSRTGRGSAEILSALGVNVDASPHTQARCLERAGVCFCFAIHHHPAAKHAAGVRKALGFPTIFNLLGPLCNPALAPRQLLGVYEKAAVEKMAHALVQLGSQRAFVVHGSDGMDEITTTGTTTIAQVQDGAVRVVEFDPAAHGVARSNRSDLECNSLEDAVRVAREVVQGKKGPQREIVLVNAAGALIVCGEAESWEEGMYRASKAIDGGGATRTLEELVSVSRAHEGEP